MDVLRKWLEKGRLAGRWVVKELRTFRGPDDTSPYAKLIAAIVISSLIAVAGFGIKVIYGYAGVERLRFATGRPGSEYFTFGAALKEIFDKHHRGIEIELVSDVEGSCDSMNRLQQNEVDMALAQNDTPAEGSVRSIALLFPELLHLYVRGESGVDRVDQLRGKRIATLPAGSGTACVLENLLDHYGVGADEDSTEIIHMDPNQAHESFRKGEVDAVFHIIALGAAASEHVGPSLRSDGRLLPIEQAEALRQRHPFLEAIDIPKGFYRGYPPEPSGDIPTAAVSAALLVSKNLDKDVVYELTRTLYEHRNELVSSNPLAAWMRRPAKPEETLFPLHAGARAYYDRDKPGVWVAYADPLALGLSLTVLCISGIWHVRLRLAQMRKDRADKYSLEILGLLERLRSIEDSLEEMEEVRAGLFDIFKRVVRDVADDKVSTESFHLFAFPWEMAIGAIRHRELTLSKEPVRADVSKKRNVKKKAKKKE